jgi:hypothetical protein
MARSYFWDRGVFDSENLTTFEQFQLTTNLAGDTLVRFRAQVWADQYGPIPLAFPVVNGMLWNVGVYDGPWSTWVTDHPSVPAESSYGWLHQERTQWELEEHTIEATKYERWLSPRGALQIDNQTQRLIKVNGDGVFLSGWLFPVGGGLNPISMRIHGSYEALFLSVSV